MASAPDPDHAWLKYASKVELDTPEEQVDEFTIRNVHAAFNKVRQLGQGTYGKVYLARDKQTGEEVALKKIKLEASKEKREGFPITAIREIRVLMSLEHENVIQLKEIVRSNITQSNKFKGSIYLVFEYMQHDLAGLHERLNKSLEPSMVKWFMRQTLQGLQYCHARSVLHRDLKASNLLINDDGILKLADFGLARPRVKGEQSDGQLTALVCTLWYMPPELLLGCTKYGGEVDMWSAGCILYELLVGKPLFAGSDDPGQLDQIFSLLGTPTLETCPKVIEYKFWSSVIQGKYPKNRLRKHLEERRLTPDACDLLEGLLQLNPERRLTAAQALDAAYFRADPPPMTTEQFRLSGFAPSHEYIVKGKDKRKLVDSSDTNDETAAPPPKKAYHHSSRGLPEAVTVPGIYSAPSRTDNYHYHAGQTERPVPPALGSPPPHLPPQHVAFANLQGPGMDTHGGLYSIR